VSDPPRRARSGLQHPALCPALAIAIAVVAFLAHLPDLQQNVPYSIYPDEQRVIGRGLLMWRDGAFDPEEYLYPSLSINLQRFWAEVTFPLARALGQVSDPSEVQWTTHRHLVQPALVVWGRALVAGLGALGVLLAYAAGSRLRDCWAGLAAAALLATNEFYWSQSVIGSADPMAAFSSLLWACALLYFLAGPSSRRTMLLGVAVGLTAASKYNAGVAAVTSLVAVWLLGCESRPERWRSMGQLLLGCGAGFFAGMPVALWKPHEVVSTILWQFDTYVSSGQLPEVTATSFHAKARHDFLFLSRSFVVWPMAALFFPLLGWRAWRHGWRDPYVLLMSYPALFILLMVNTRLMYDRNYTLVFPFFAIASGYWLSVLGTAVDRRRNTAEERTPIAAWATLALVAVLVLPVVIEMPRRLAAPQKLDTRSQAAAFIQREVVPLLGPDEKIGVARALEVHPTDLAAMGDRVAIVTFGGIGQQPLRQRRIRFLLMALPPEDLPRRSIADATWQSGELLFEAGAGVLPLPVQPIRDPWVRVIRLD
jgi:4-amino-4-deoxy-L-arabinose transferase-like glycosyltransferase